MKARTLKSRKPKKPPATDPESLYNATIRALARRARSSGEVRALLLRRKAAPADVEAVIQRLLERGYLDDARFARSFVASRVENDLHGRTRVRRDLAARRVRPEIAEAALRQAFDALDEAKLLRRHLQRKVRVTRLNKPSAVQGLYRRLLRAGFRSDTIVGELKRLLRASSRPPSHGLNGPNGPDGPDGSGEPLRWDELLDSLAESEDLENSA